MKHMKPVYVYKNREYIGEFKSIREAAQKLDCDENVISRITRGLAISPVTRKGYHFSLKPLTDEELQMLPIIEQKSGYVKVDDRKCVQRIRRYEYEVNCKDRKITFQARNKAERIKDFNAFLQNALKDRWRYQIPEKVAVLEQQLIKEFLDSIK